MSKPKAGDYMIALLLILQHMEETAKKDKEFLSDTMTNLSALKDAKNINASNLYAQLEGMRSSYDIALLHNENAQKRVASIMEALKEKEDSPHAE